jgi:hypothetical protein
MTSPTSWHTAPQFPPQARPKNWFDRNWKWLVPLVAVVIVLIVAAFVGTLFYAKESSLRKSYPYQVTVRRAKESPQVAATIGTHLQIGWFATGNFNFNGTEGNENISIPISGQNARGHIVVVANKHATHWNFETLEVDVEGQDNPIPLLDYTGPASATPDSN